MYGWRTIVIREKCVLSICDDQLCIEKGKLIKRIPLEQIAFLILESGSTELSVSDVSILAAKHIKVVFCDNNHLPSCELMPIGQHHESAGCVMDQLEWKKKEKDDVWKEIVEMKMQNHERLMCFLGKGPSAVFNRYMKSVEPGDSTNREALAAKIYFRSIFGSEFRRHHSDETNSMLNYGYAILCSEFSRILAAHGYHASLGIHHCSRDNAVNLSCDLMEPFRPLVDQLALRFVGKKLEWEIKKEFISIPSKRCWVNGKSSDVENAVEIFALKTLEAVKKGKGELPEVRFV